jgi:CopG family nickel-responsive transcriptional regulator
VEPLPIVSLSISDVLLGQVDARKSEKGFVSRSEIFRHALRAFLAEDVKIDELEGEIIATVTIIYNESADRRNILASQHVYSGIVSTFLHTHIREGSCLEVIILKGPAAAIKKFLDNLRSNEQIVQTKVSLVDRQV